MQSESKTEPAHSIRRLRPQVIHTSGETKTTVRTTRPRAGLKDHVKSSLSRGIAMSTTTTTTTTTTTFQSSSTNKFTTDSGQEPPTTKSAAVFANKTSTIPVNTVSTKSSLISNYVNEADVKPNATSTSTTQSSTSAERLYTSSSKSADRSTKPPFLLEEKSTKPASTSEAMSTKPSSTPEARSTKPSSRSAERSTKPSFKSAHMSTNISSTRAKNSTKQPYTAHANVSIAIEKKMDTYTNYSLEHYYRMAHLKNICSHYNIYNNSLYKGVFEGSFLRSARYNFTVCKVAKVGSTFWIQLLSTLDFGINNGKAIFETKRSSIHGRTGKFRTTVEQAKVERTILMSRDPYSRLYSAYVDKIFLPLMFFTSYNIRHKNYLRDDSDPDCPIDVSFHEFLAFTVKVASRGSNWNHHWAPIATYCHPCTVKPYLVVKQETFGKDIEFVLDSLNVTKEEKMLVFDALNDNRVELTVSGLVKTVYGWAAKDMNIFKCFGWQKLAERLWISFQIQGYVRRGWPFPHEMFDHEGHYSDADFVANSFMNVIKTHPMASEESREQRRQYLCQAYSNIPNDIISAIQTIYQYDFLVFNYSITPPCWKD